MDVSVGLWRKLSTKELMLWTVVLEKTLESPLDCKQIQPVHSEGDQPWDFFGRNDAKAETPVLWPPHAKSWLIGKHWCWEGLGARGEGDDRGWDGWMVPFTRRTWVWMNSGSWWWTGRPGVLRFMGSQRVRHDWAIDLIWLNILYFQFRKIFFSFWLPVPQFPHLYMYSPLDIVKCLCIPNTCIPTLDLLGKYYYFKNNYLRKSTLFLTKSISWLLLWLSFPCGINSKETSCQCMRGKRHGLDAWIGKIL